MEKVIPYLFVTLLVVIVFWMFRKAHRTKREKLIASYPFPDRVRRKIFEHYPHLEEKEVDQVISGLREYFHLCNIAGKRMVSMPSQAVDVAWHEFILFTRSYKNFCSKALGRFLHHTPAEAMASPTIAQKGIKTAWKIACMREQINPKIPDRLPLLFALDAILNIPDGFKYSLNCKSAEGYGFCAGHIGCASDCAGGCSGDSGGDGCSGGCSGGCGGD